MVAGLVLCLGGAFSMAGAICDWDFFMNNYRARLFVRLLGRKGARVLYVIFGLILLAMGVASAAGLLPKG